jgi:uracil-DNA glycosylase
VPALDDLISEARACRLCAEHLPLGPRPVLRASATARLLIIGQAPGTKVHESGVPWDDKSGDRLRDWLQLDKQTFYDERQIAIIPMGFCYPGRDKNGGDAPPRPECASTWHRPLLALMPDIRLTLLVGSYAQNHHLAGLQKRTMTETVKNWQRYAPAVVPLPHPSWRNTSWLKKNPWFEKDLLPGLRKQVGITLNADRA